MRINKLFIIIVLASTIFMLSCSKDTDAKTNSKTNVYERGKPMSWGHEQTIYVFADSDIWKDAEYYIKYSLERPFYTVQNEKLYEIKLGDMNALDQFYKYKNLLFLCDLSSDKPVAQSVKKMMNTEMKDYVNNRGVGLFANHNHWANEQFVVFMIGTNTKELTDFYKSNGNELFYHFRQKLVERIKHKQQRFKPVSMDLFAKFPFTLQVPENYILYKSDPEACFISFIWRSREDQKLNPDKYISVYYEKMPDKTNRTIEQEWVKKTRAKIAWDFYDEDEMKDSDVQYGLYKFIDYPTWYMSGRWQNKKYFIGGAFQAMGFFDEQTKTAFLIDTSVYFPQGDKLKFLMELESIAQTFKLKEVTK